MAYKILADQCTSCGACEFECSSGAISTKRGTYRIDAGTCTECKGTHARPQCATVCPVDACVPA